jgi:membrane protein implicated in regulation of membrane protease activity
MQALSDMVAQFGAWAWFVLAVVLFVLESFVPGVHFLWFGVSAAVVGLIAFVVPIAWPWQVIAFALIALATVFWVRNKSREESAKTDAPDLNIRGAQYIGRIVTVEDAITNGRGRVRLGDTVWLVKGQDAPSGSRVKVTGIDGTVLIVAAVDAIERHSA